MDICMAGRHMYKIYCCFPRVLTCVPNGKTGW